MSDTSYHSVNYSHDNHDSLNNLNNNFYHSISNTNVISAINNQIPSAIESFSGNVSADNNINFITNLPVKKRKFASASDSTSDGSADNIDEGIGIFA